VPLPVRGCPCRATEGLSPAWSSPGVGHSFLQLRALNTNFFKASVDDEISTCITRRAIEAENRGLGRSSRVRLIGFVLPSLRRRRHTNRMPVTSDTSAFSAMKLLSTTTQAVWDRSAHHGPHTTRWGISNLPVGLIFNFSFLFFSGCKRQGAVIWRFRAFCFSSFFPFFRCLRIR
jgi:hypothetical protein